MSLEPRQVLLMESPRLPLELPCREILRIRPLLVVKHEKEGIHVELFKDGGVFEELRRGLRVVERGGVRVFRDVVFGPVEKVKQEMSVEAITPMDLPRTHSHFSQSMLSGTKEKLLSSMTLAKLVSCVPFVDRALAASNDSTRSAKLGGSLFSAPSCACAGGVGSSLTTTSDGGFAGGCPAVGVCGNGEEDAGRAEES